jgi:aspartate-semialdehyde dehydrogenase
VYAEFERETDLEEAEKALLSSESIEFYANTYVTPRELNGTNNSHVCRLRYGCDKHSLTFWNVGHNIRIGAAANAVRILKQHAAFNR